MILARTDALKTDGFEAAIERCLAFREAGCDMTFLEAPESIEQMMEYCRRVEGAKLANMLEQGSTPVLPPQELKKMGYTMAAYPLTLLSASIKAMMESLDRIQKGTPTDDIISSCKCTQTAISKYRSCQLLTFLDPSRGYKGCRRIHQVRKRGTALQSIDLSINEGPNRFPGRSSVCWLWAWCYLGYSLRFTLNLVPVRNRSASDMNTTDDLVTAHTKQAIQEEIEIILGPTSIVAHCCLGG